MERIRQALDRARRDRTELALGADAGLAPTDLVVPTGAISGATLLAARPARGTASEAAAGSRPKAPMRARSVAIDADWIDDHRLLLPGSRAPAAEAFRLLRTQVLQRMREQGWQTIGVVSARSRDGKSTVAANLAVAIATDPRHTALLVDLDLRRPQLAGLFGLSDGDGVEDVLQGAATIDQRMVHPSAVERLRLLPASTTATSRPAGLTAEPACQAMLAELRARYANRIIVIDMPPVLDADEALTLAPFCDCLLFVVAEGRTARDDVTRALSLLHRHPIVGTVLNCSVEAVRVEAYG